MIFGGFKQRIGATVSHRFPSNPLRHRHNPGATQVPPFKQVGEQIGAQDGKGGSDDPNLPRRDHSPSRQVKFKFSSPDWKAYPSRHSIKVKLELKSKTINFSNLFQ